jgi:hypothetical protein
VRASPFCVTFPPSESYFSFTPFEPRIAGAPQGAQCSCWAKRRETIVQGIPTLCFVSQNCWQPPRGSRDAAQRALASRVAAASICTQSAERPS